ncbi:PepSY domain-containing protein [Sphingomonas sp. RP10(2022)]|uniref:PepSY domain-containing protein n=1 Tax=Sphingomonas liriopis TaxID=2949094 RepID=A0A9X2HXN8_9SPHN|nr:PepSY domain-containing protein [Sphingomonas liriopis]
MTRAQRVRVAVRRVHLWLGLSVGLLFAIVGLTGSVLVFYPAIDTALHPGLARVPAGARPESWQAVYDALRRDHPGRTGAWRIEVTPEGGPIPIRYYTPVETQGRDFAPLLLWLDPVSLRAVRSGFWGGTWTSWIYDLHYRLLMEKPGGTVLGVLGIVMLAMLVSGLWAWWPRSGGWRRSLAWKRRASRSRRLYDLHKWSGIGGALVLIVVTATGVMLDLPDQVRPVVATTSPLFATPKVASVPRSGGFLPLDVLVRRAGAVLPGSALAWIETPADARGTVRINLMVPGEPSRRFPRSNVWFDPYDGRVLAVRDERRDSGGDTLLAWLHPLHGGEAFGLVGRWLVFVSGLLPAVLFVTGVWRWRLRMRSAAG